MSSPMFVANAALTAISVLRQKAKSASKSEGIKLSEALDRIAQEEVDQNWDEMIFLSWHLSSSNDSSSVWFSRRNGDRQIHVGATNRSKGDHIKYAHLNHRNSADGRIERFFMTTLKNVGHEVAMSEDDLKGIDEENSLRDRFSILLKKYNDLQGTLPITVGPAPAFDFTYRSEEEDYEDLELPEPSDFLKVVVELPEPGKYLEADVPLHASAEDFRASVKPMHTQYLYDFRFQKDGSLIMRRAKHDEYTSPKTSMHQAIRMITFLSWTGLEVPVSGVRDNVLMEVFDIGDSKLYDHYDAMRDTKSGATVIINQPYGGHSHIIEFGLLNLLKPGTATFQGAPWAALHSGANLLLHTVRNAGADLEVIGRGAMIAARHARGVTVEECDVKAKTKARAQPKGASTGTRKKPLISPIENIPFVFEELDISERALLKIKNIPDIETLLKPYQKKKLKTFPSEAPSWAFVDAWQSGDSIQMNELIAAIKKQPYDADLWGMLPVFEISSKLKIELLRRGVAAGEIYLGKMMKEEVGNFWGILSTRPYMRCMNLLYRELVKARMPAFAAPIGREMLELCPNDNIGIRFSIGDVEKAVNDKDFAEELAYIFEDQDAEDRI